MILFSTANDPCLSNLPPPASIVVIHHLHTLQAICGHDPDPEKDGYVGFVERHDTPESVQAVIGRHLQRLEGTFLQDGCLVGVVLWGNSGAGLTIICPDLEGHAPEVATFMRNHLPLEENNHE